MNDVTKAFFKTRRARQLIALYEGDEVREDGLALLYDIDPKTDRPINAHPLTEKEAKKIAQTLYRPEKKEKEKTVLPFLHCNGLFPESVLYVNFERWEVIWYSQAGLRPLYFKDVLEIPNGNAQVPPMIWKATQHSLSVWAITSNERPTEKTKLFHAPYFNINGAGSVCLGSVKHPFEKDCSIQEFIRLWESYFFNSYFSHANGILTPKTNILDLWRSLIKNPKEPFPVELLAPTKNTLASLLPMMDV